MALATTSGGYRPGSGFAGGTGTAYDVSSEDTDARGFWSLEKCKRAYSSYLGSKRAEIDEQISSRRYRHGAQWTSEQIKVLNDRKQPVVTYNYISRKINATVGLVERLRQSPKAYPRSPQHQQGADLATAGIRYVLDNNNWTPKSAQVAEAAAIDGLAGIELNLRPSEGKPRFEGQKPDYDIFFEVTDNDGFFYDPRSFKHDFSDAIFLGMGKWIDEDRLTAMLPQYKDQLKGALSQGIELTAGSDRDNRWFDDAGEFPRVRLVDLWYKLHDVWCWALFTGSTKLADGISPFEDETGKSIPRYLMFSAAVDHDGDRYGFVRMLQSAQDEVNQRRSKGLHELNSRRIRATKAAVAGTDVERLRREAARPDGIVLSDTSLDDIAFDDMAKQAAVMGQLEFMREAKQEIENFGPNAALIGDMSNQRSGRAIALLQQAGIAELGPYMINLRGWKIRVYRAVFNAIQKFWTNERWIRVTDNDGLQQFVQINALQVDPMTGSPQIANAIGDLDVDIVLDEGPDNVTLMQDTYDAISNALPAVAKMLSPAQATAALEVLIETSQLPADVKKKFRDAGQQQQGPPPQVQIKQAELQMEQQFKQAELAMDQQAQQQELQIDREKAAQDQQIEQARAASQMEIERMKAFNTAMLQRQQARAQAEATGMRAMGQAAAAMRGARPPL